MKNFNEMTIEELSAEYATDFDMHSDKSIDIRAEVIKRNNGIGAFMAHNILTGSTEGQNETYNFYPA